MSGTYVSPLGTLLLEADTVGLTGLRFTADCAAAEPSDLPALAAARRWLDIYFSGGIPDFLPPLHLCGTAFQQAVWQLLLQLPYGAVTTYGALAKALAAQRGAARMSAQAVGGAVGRNPVAILVPCHRVIGADGTLVGYAAGLDKKAALLELERAHRPVCAPPAE